ncbi:MAG: hypothetical protein AB1333_02910 [Patescibacteria group bacterium]
MTRVLTIKEATLLLQKVKELKSITRPMVENIPGLIASRDKNAADSLENELDVLGAQIKSLETDLKNARFIFPEKQDKEVWMGNIILASFDGNPSSEFIMSDLVERNDGRMAISSSSPVGKAILGKSMGRYEIQLPKKKMVMEIHKILPPED